MVTLQLTELPRWALLAFAARCARRVVYLYKPNEAETLSIARVRHALEVAERSSTVGKYKETVYVYGGPKQAYDAFQFLTYEAFNPNDPASCARAAVNGALDAEMAIAAGQTDDLFSPADGAVQAALQAGHTLGPERSAELTAGIQEDYDILKDAATRENWTDDTPVPTHFFPHNSVFETESHIEGSNIIGIKVELNEKFVEYFRRYPDRLSRLSPRQFEELIAELFEGFGFDVELTKQTRDGGKDIVAVKHNSTRDKYLIECKRYAQKRRVGIDVVQRLYGVVKLESACKGIVVTTSKFSAPANQIITANWELEGADLDDITRWLEAYQRSRI